MKRTSGLTAVEKRAIMAELVKRERSKTAQTDKYLPTARELALAEELKKTWFPKQAAFFRSKHRRKVGFCTRRAGKTIGAAICILATLLENPSGLALYVAQTSQMARLYIWAELKKMVARWDLPFEFNETNLFMKHTRAGGTLLCKGADKADEVEKWRGPKWQLAILDESGTFGAHIENAVVSVIGPALRDNGGTLILIGTAGRKKEGLFFEASTGLRKHYEVHSWSLVDNPYLSDEAKDLAFIREEEGLTEEDPKYIREYLGKWAAADSERVFSGFTQERNTYEGKLPQGHDWKYLLGCDFGWNDASAVTVVAYAPTHPCIHIVDNWTKKHAYPSDIAAQIEVYKAKYGVRRYIGDTGGYGKAIVVQLARDYGIMMQPAKKQEKLSFVEFMNSEFYVKKIMVHKSCKVLIDELVSVAWNADRTDVDKHEHDDAAFSAVYGWRAARNSGAGKTAMREQDPTDARILAARREKYDILRKVEEKKDSWYDTYSGGSQDADRDHGNPWWDISEDRRRRS